MEKKIKLQKIMCPTFWKMKNLFAKKKKRSILNGLQV